MATGDYDNKVRRGDTHTGGAVWLEDFVRQPQWWCDRCFLMNEVNPPSWWRANCRHPAPVPPSKTEGA